MEGVGVAESPRVPVQRKKISIRPIPEARKRQVTFMKRKKGLLKKAKELSFYSLFPCFSLILP